MVNIQVSGFFNNKFIEKEDIVSVKIQYIDKYFQEDTTNCTKLKACAKELTWALSIV